MNWKKVEQISGEKLPTCIKEILNACGYDTFGSLKCLSEQSVQDIEKHINIKSRATIEALKCCRSEYYKSLDEFKFIPGHKDLIISLSKLDFSTNQEHDLLPESNISYFLNELVKTAATIGKKCSKYSDVIRWFGTYIFLQCGRSCYELLNQNLPLPSTRTIRETIGHERSLSIKVRHQKISTLLHFCAIIFW